MRAGEFVLSASRIETTRINATGAIVCRILETGSTVEVRADGSVIITTAKGDILRIALDGSLDYGLVTA
jgi:hypothetical protein